MMRKCEIAVGVIDLILAVLLVLPPYVVHATEAIGIVGSTDGPTVIYIRTRISNTAFFVMASTGMLLLIPPRWKVIVILSILFGSLYVALAFFTSTSIVSLILTQPNPHFGKDWHTQSLIATACLLLFNIANMSLLLRRGVREWRNKRHRASA